MGTIVVWFSCGAASAVALKETINRYGSEYDIRAVNNPVAEEDPDNRRFLRDVERWLGINIEACTHPKYPNASAAEVWENRQYMSGIKGAPCTEWLKKKARHEWEKSNNFDHVVMGFTADEAKRHLDFCLTEREILPVLIDAGLTKEDCYRAVADAGIALPAIYERGYPNANCIGCVKASSPTYWNHVRKHDPDVFAVRAEQSRRIGAKLVRVKGERIYLDELDPKAKGRPMKHTAVECGIFCEEEL